MSNNRLIINARGETAKVIASVNGTSMLQVSVRYDRIVHLLRGTHETCEFELNPREALALAAQLADAAGYAAEFTKVRRSPTRSSNMPSNYTDADFPIGDSSYARKIVPGKPGEGR